MGHAGAIVTGSAGTVAAKSEALIAAGALVADRPSKVGEMLLSLMPDNGRDAPGGVTPGGVTPGGEKR